MERTQMSTTQPAGPEINRVGFVGLGAMGGRIAGRLLATGHSVVGTNRTAAKAAPLIERGLEWRDTPREVAQAAELVLSMVTDDAALAAVTSGEDGILAGLSPGKLYVDTSTVSPAVSRELANRVRGLGGDMLDAPVSGTVTAAEDGTLVIMVGGDEKAFGRVEPFLRRFARTVTYIGENGYGLLLKLAINISLGVQMLAFSEGVLLAERGGVDREVAVKVMTESAIGSPMLQARAPLVLDLPEEPWFDVDLMQKDIALALGAGRALTVPLPSAAVADELLTIARALGYGHRDIASLFEVLAHVAAPQSAEK
jgi:3-hydroxyisobutyrate dehydrogenase-like beta-hydroxyacid dehydrogenase